MEASAEGDTSTVKLLLEAGANTEPKDEVKERLSDREPYSHPFERDVRVKKKWRHHSLFASRLLHFTCALRSSASCFLLIFFRCERAHLTGCQMQKRMSDILFCTEFNFWANCESHLTSCDGARVFWENEKIQWKNPFLVASALVSLLVSIVSNTNSETCFEIAKVTIWQESGFRSLIRARERLHFQIQDFAFFVPVCPCSSTYTCTLIPLTLIDRCWQPPFSLLVSHFSFFFFVFFFGFPFALSMVCVCLSLYLYTVCPNCAYLGLEIRWHANCEALVGSGG